MKNVSQPALRPDEPGADHEVAGSLAALLNPALDPLFWPPSRVGAVSAWWGHVPFAHWLVAQARPRLVVELGTHNGVSYAAFCEAVLREGLDARCYAVDTWQGDEHAGFYGEEVFSDLSKFNEARYGAFSELLRCSFDSALGYVADGSVDLLHIDGLHSYEAVRHDFESWAPKLSERAVVLFHDTNVKERDFGVWRYWAELRERYPGFEFLHGHGLGILAVGREASGPAAELCRLSDPKAVSGLRERFARLGERWIGEARIRLLEGSSAEAQGKLQAELAAVTSRAQQDTADLEQRARAELAAATGANERLGEELAATVAELKDARSELKAKTSEREQLAFELRTTLERLDAQRGSLDASSRQLAELQGAEAERNLILGSTSWRITGPLRAVATRLPARPRREARRLARVLWWTATMRLPQRLRERRAVLEQLRQLHASGAFNEGWYLERYPDVAESGLDAAVHYVTRGAAEGRAPGPNGSGNSRPGVAGEGASSSKYLTTHPELQGRPPAQVEASVSVVIPTYNAGPEFYWLLRKLKQQRGVRSLEIITVDSGSSDGTDRLAAEMGCKVVKIRKEEFSHSFSRNRGAQEASGDLLLFMVQDAYPVGDHWLNGLAAALQQTHDGQKLAALSCTEISRCDSDILYDALIDTHYRFLGCRDGDRVGRLTREDHESLRSQGQISDIACLIPRAIFERYGYQGRYAEDLLLGIKLIRDGHRVALLSSIPVIHSHRRPSGYFLRRVFVDVTFLVEIFSDYTVPDVRSARSILAAAFALRDALPRLAPSLTLSPAEALAWAIAVIRRLDVSAATLDGVEGDFGYAPFGAWVRDVARLPWSEADRQSPDGRQLKSMFIARLENLEPFLAAAYPALDAAITAELNDAIAKTLAMTLGAQLAFLFLTVRRGAANRDAALVRELEALMIEGI